MKVRFEEDKKELVFEAETKMDAFRLGKIIYRLRDYNLNYSIQGDVLEVKLTSGVILSFLEFED